jgi:hypothetical protein
MGGDISSRRGVHSGAGARVAGYPCHTEIRQFTVAKQKPKTPPATKPRPVRRARLGSAGSPPPVGDVALVLAKDGRGTHILRRRAEGGPIEQGVLQPLTEGKPIDGEVVSLQQRPEFPLLFDVKSEWTPPGGRLTSDGPAQVASDAYRRGWDAVWGTGEPDRLN